MSVTAMVRATPPLITVIVAVFGPTTAEDRATWAAMDPLPVPDDGLRVSQLALLLAVQLPFELTVTVWLAGFVPPCMPVTVNDVGLTVRVGEGAVTVKVTGIATGAALVALTVIRAWYVSAVREPVVAVAVTEPLPVPEVEERLNQAAFSLAVQVRSPPPVLEMLTVCELELLPPSSAVKERLTWLVRITGGTDAATTVRLTGMVTAVAPAALRVMIVL